MIRRVVASYLKKLADLEHDFTQEVHNRKVDKWEGRQLDKLDPYRVLNRRVKEQRDENKNNIWLQKAIEDPGNAGREYLLQGKIKGVEPEFVDAVEQFINSKPEHLRSGEAASFVLMGVPVQHLVAKRP